MSHSTNKFKQVLYNLRSNAIKFTDEGDKVEIRAAMHDAHHFKLLIQDTGIGIKTEDITRLFKEFEQLESGAWQQGTRTGLGIDTENRGVTRRYHWRGERCRAGQLLYGCAAVGTGGNQRLIPDSSRPPAE